MKSIPYAPAAPILGKLLDFRRDQLDFFTRMARDYGDIVHYRLLYVNVYQLNSPDTIHQVLVEQADKFEKAELDHKIFNSFLGSGLIISEGDFHRRQRRLMQPAFHSKRINAYAEAMTDYSERLLDEWHDGAQIDIHEAMSTLTRRIVLKTLFNTDDAPEAEQIAEAVGTLNQLGENAYRRGFTYPRWQIIPAVRQSEAAVAEIDRLILGIIEKRRASHDDRGDLLSMLLLAQDEDDGGTMSDRQVRDEAVTLFMAGHETTANALSWAFYLLAQHPEAEAKLHAELDRVLAGRTPTLQDLAQLPYTDWVIKEAIRLYPPAWILNGRTPLEDVDIDGYTLPRGSTVFLSPYVVQRDPRYYDAPDQFVPERWADDFEKRLPRYAYFPFGGGPRICIGNSFATMEARLVLATIAREVRMQTQGAVEPLPLITLRPRAMPATVRQRAPEKLAV